MMSIQPFLATPQHLILTTQTFFRNSSAPDSYYTKNSRHSSAPLLATRYLGIFLVSSFIAPILSSVDPRCHGTSPPLDLHRRSTCARSPESRHACGTSHMLSMYFLCSPTAARAALAVAAHPVGAAAASGKTLCSLKHG